MPTAAQIAASRANGLKGGRPRTASRKEAIIARDFFIKKVTENLKPIVKILITKAKKGDMQAIKELLDRSFGSPKQSVESLNINAEVSISDVLDRLEGRVDDHYEDDDTTTSSMEAAETPPFYQPEGGKNQDVVCDNDDNPDNGLDKPE